MPFGVPICYNQYVIMSIYETPTGREGAEMRTIETDRAVVEIIAWPEGKPW